MSVRDKVFCTRDPKIWIVPESWQLTVRLAGIRDGILLSNRNADMMPALDRQDWRLLITTRVIKPLMVGTCTVQ